MTRNTIKTINRLVAKSGFTLIFTMFPQEDSLRFFCCHRGHNEETKSVEFAFVAICLRLTHHNDCTIKGIMAISLSKANFSLTLSTVLRFPVILVASLCSFFPY